MRLALLGGTGRIGRHLLALTLADGHDVTLLARNPATVPPARALTVVMGDATDASAVSAVIAGSDAVLSALGPRGDKTPELLGTAARIIVASMDTAGVRRLISVSAAGPFIAGDPDSGRLVSFLLPRILARPFADVRAMESVIAASGLDWTLVRATRLVNVPQTGRYRVRPQYPPPGGRSISRADVAHFVATALREHSWGGGRPALAY